MQRQSLGAGVVLALVAASCGATPAPALECPETPAPAAVVVPPAVAAAPPATPAPTPPPATPAVAPPSGSGEEEEEPRVPRPVSRVGECNVGWLPAGMVTDLAPEQTARLASLMLAWMRDAPGIAPTIDWQRGIVHATSADYTVDEGPHPTAAAAQSSLACGQHAVWLAHHARELLRQHADEQDGGITCQENVCCFQALMEYDRGGVLVFRARPRDGWALGAVAVVDDGDSLEEDAAAANRRFIAGRLARHARGRCRGEPAATE